MRNNGRRATVATVIEPNQRTRMDAAVGNQFSALHAESVEDALRVVRSRPIRAVLVSPRCVVREHLTDVVALTRAFPGVPTVAVLSTYDAVSSQRLLDLGSCGVRRMLDLSQRDGWNQLRDLLAHPATPAAALVLSVVVPALGDPSEECRQFFTALVRLAPAVTTVRELSRRLGIAPSTFMSRFLRAALPSPKRYLAAIRLVYAAALLDAPGRSIADVAYQLEYSSPQSFGRHTRTVLGLTGSEFRKRYGFDQALREFVGRLVVPFRSVFRTFRPLAHGVGSPEQARC